MVGLFTKEKLGYGVKFYWFKIKSVNSDAQLVKQRQSLGDLSEGLIFVVYGEILRRKLV